VSGFYDVDHGRVSTVKTVSGFYDVDHGRVSTVKTVSGFICETAAAFSL